MPAGNFHLGGDEEDQPNHNGPGDSVLSKKEWGVNLTESKTVLAVAPTFCVTYIPEKLKKAMLNIVRTNQTQSPALFPS